MRGDRFKRRWAWQVIVCGWLCVAPLHAQRLTFSVDVQGPTAGSFGNDGSIVDAFYGQEIDGGDILTVGVPPMPLPPGPNLAVRGPVSQAPGIVVFGSNPGIANARTLNLIPTPIGSRPDPELELDALSFGRDSGRAVFFSVDEFSLGLGGGVTDQAMLEEASADVFRFLSGPAGNLLVLDGVGDQQPNRALGLGLREPNPPGPGRDLGDNLDALDVNTTDQDLQGPIYFSLDAGFTDPLEAPNPQGPNIGSAQQNNVSPADILIFPPQARSPQVYLPAVQLGLDPLGDDVDALALLDGQQNGSFDPGEDQLLFSVRRGSRVIGQLDSAFGFPISAGDILAPPGDPNQPPQIVIPAEALGLNANRNVGAAAAIAEPEADDLNALSLGLQDGDMNCNLLWDVADVPAFALALESSTRYDAAYFSLCFGPAELHGDLNLDGRFGFEDIEDFVQVMENAGTLDAAMIQQMLAAHAPEPQCPRWVVGSICCWLCRSRRRNRR